MMIMIWKLLTAHDALSYMHARLHLYIYLSVKIFLKKIHLSVFSYVCESSKCAGREFQSVGPNNNNNTTKDHLPKMVSCLPAGWQENL